MHAKITAMMIHTMIVYLAALFSKRFVMGMRASLASDHEAGRYSGEDCDSDCSASTDAVRLVIARAHTTRMVDVVFVKKSGNTQSVRYTAS